MEQDSIWTLVARQFADENIAEEAFARHLL